jgi:hypothetical protein
MARQITVLEQNLGEQGTRQVKLVFWYPVVGATKQVPKPGLISQATNVLAQEQADLEAGLIREEVVFVSFPSSYTTAQMKAEINARYTDKAAAVAAEPAVRAFYAVTFDSVGGWSA